MGEFRVEHVSELTGSQAARVTAICPHTFAPHHRVPLAELAATGPADMLVGAVDGDEAVGFAALRLIGEAGWTSLRCCGIAADRRGTAEAGGSAGCGGRRPRRRAGRPG